MTAVTDALVDNATIFTLLPANAFQRPDGRFIFAETGRVRTMKIKNSLKSLESRDRNNRVVRRKGRVYVINKQNPRFKARQG